MIMLIMYLIDTNIISELRKKKKANRGVQQFFETTIEQEQRLFISAITIGELRRGVEMIYHRGDKQQADTLNKWLNSIVSEFVENILDFTVTESQVWGYLRVPRHENAIDKQIAATALTHDLIVVTRNVADFSETGVKLLNPFE